MPAKEVRVTPPSLRAMGSLGSMLVTELRAIRCENRNFQTAMFATVERNAVRLEEQISGLSVHLKETRVELQAERERAMKTEGNIGERLDGQALETTANRRKLETLESKVRRLETLLADAIAARDRQQEPERSIKEGNAAATTGDTATHKSCMVSGNEKAIATTKVLLETSSQILACIYILAYFTANQIAHTTLAPAWGMRNIPTPSYPNRKFLLYRWCSSRGCIK